MPGKYFKCPDNQTIEITKCLENNGCRMNERCATRPFLRLIGYDRKWNGVTPSAAGNGPRLLYLKATVDYVIDPNDRVFSAIGVGTHAKMSIHKYTNNVLSEEPLSDEEMRGIADCLEEDENKSGYFILTDYKTGGSFKVCQYLGVVSEKTEETVLAENKKPVILKSGKNKGKAKTIQKTVIKIDPTKIDMKSEELQLNRYRIFYEQYGYPISKIQIQATPRDGGTYLAINRGIEKNIYIIPVKRLPTKDVLNFYRELSQEVLKAFNEGYIRLCNMWECWNYRRCEKYCEVSEACKTMSKNNNERWGIL